jgi:hypothetical protein
MQRISSVERPGPVLRALYHVGERMFGAVPTPAKIMAHRVPLMLGLGGLYTAMERCGVVDPPLRALLNIHVARLHGSAY